MQDKIVELLAPIYEIYKDANCPTLVKDLISPKFKMSIRNNDTKIEALVKLVNVYTTALLLNETVTTKPSKQHMICIAFYLRYDVINRDVRRALADYLKVSDKDVNSFNRALRLNNFLISDKFKSGIYHLSPELKKLKGFIDTSIKEEVGLNILIKIDV